MSVNEYLKLRETGVGEQPRKEYPRPQFERGEWLNLNGKWAFELDPGESGVERKLYDNDTLSGEILVPFCPESKLSGVAHTDFIRGCWYTRAFELPDGWQGGHVLINFGAVNYEAHVYINGVEAGEHEGGYSSFSFDVTPWVKPGMNRVTVYVRSDVRAGTQPSGKQSERYYSAGCSYTRTTGIWQTVWLEHVPQAYLRDIRITPNAADSSVHITAEVVGGPGELRATATYDGTACGQSAAKVSGNSVNVDIKLSETHLWNVGAPELYDLKLELRAPNGDCDMVTSYFGLRDITMSEGSILINGKPVYQRLVLDQGFNPDGVITAPDDSELRADIERSLAMGFNGARMHQKIFEPRFIYWADKLGYILWGEHGNWGLDIGTDAGLAHFLPEWLETVARDYSSPAIVGWCPFNETQPNTSLRVLRATYHATKLLDPTRPVIDTSGWTHCGETDVYDYHDYEADPAILEEHIKAYASAKPGENFPDPLMPFALRLNRHKTRSTGQPVMLSEFGGIAYFPNGIPEGIWGYGKILQTEDEFAARFGGQVHAALTTPGICGFCYTQLTDVEQESNGLYTYEREPKFDCARIKAILDEPAWNERG